MKKAYIYHKYDVAPWFVCHEVEETADEFKLCPGLSWRKGEDCRVKKISKKKFEMLKSEGSRIESEHRKMVKKLKAKADALLS